MLGDEFDVPGPAFVQGGVIDDLDARVALNQTADFSPKRFRVRFQTMQQSRERIMGRGLRPMRLNPSRFGAAHHSRARNQNLHIIFRHHPRPIHGRKTNRKSSLRSTPTSSTA
jgi:hypothetical protein